MFKSTLALLLLTGVAMAQQKTDRTDAKALVGSGVKLLEAKDYLGALAIFKDAYSRFPSAKILLNIGTTYKLLGREADAANAYQKYLDSKDADPKRAAEVQSALADLDSRLGKASIVVFPAGSEVQIGDEWVPDSETKLVRFTPGELVTIHARHEGYVDGQADVNPATAGAVTTVTIKLDAVPNLESQLPPPPPIVEQHPVQVVAPVVVAEGPRSRIGALANVHVAVYPKLGSAGLVGATIDVMPALSIDAAVLLGPGLITDGMASIPPPSLGGYVGANYAFLMGSARPRIGVGVPIFSSDGARYFLRGAVGIEYVASRHLSLALDIGAEMALNPQDDIRDLAIVPALGVAGRL